MLPRISLTWLLLAAIQSLALSLPIAAWAASAIATVATDAGSRYYWVTEQPSQAAAKSEVLTGCTAHAAEDQHRAQCKLGESADGPRYWAVVLADKGGLGWKHAATRQEAIDGAYKDCVGQKRGRCYAAAAAVWFDGVAPDGSVLPAPPSAKQTPNLAIAPTLFQPSGLWTRVRAASSIQFFVDQTTLRQSDDGVTAWVLYSMADESSANLNEHKCASDQYRTLRWKHYSAPMGKGEQAEGREPEAWRSLAKDKHYRDVMQALCATVLAQKKPAR